ncbi:hypothetical protein V5R04_01510 [Jonesiaceae bacterium BS-20]|uniref:Lactococcin 972 family bacteriocin n=1 Tax=Jonesiaceae bacterium BS-20 TaxID=3120821 RepID=A0AAU7DYT7_9MICO
MKKKLSMIAASCLVAAGMIAVPVSAANASTACDGVTIKINGTAGGEPASWAYGHSHLTGKHYVGATTSNKLWYWYADNDNGSTDKPDTYYGVRQC